MIETAIGYIFDPFSYGFMARALIVSLIVGVACPLVGIFIVARGYGFMAEAVAHGVFPGMAGAFILGFSPWVGALPTAIAFSTLTGFITRRTAVQSDSAIAIVYTGMFALGVIMISLFEGRVNVRLEDILLGQILGVSNSDIIVTLAAAGLVAVVLAVFFRDFIFVSFDPVGAEVAGMPTATLNYLLLALIAVVVVITLQAVGVILALAMLVAPAAAASMVAKKIGPIIVLGIAFAITAAISGLYLSYYANFPSGSAIALVAVGIFAIVAISRRRIMLIAMLRAL